MWDFLNLYVALVHPLTLGEIWKPDKLSMISLFSGDCHKNVHRRDLDTKVIYFPIGWSASGLPPDGTVPLASHNYPQWREQYLHEWITDLFCFPLHKMTLFFWDQILTFTHSSDNNCLGESTVLQDSNICIYAFSMFTKWTCTRQAHKNLYFCLQTGGLSIWIRGSSSFWRQELMR